MAQQRLSFHLEPGSIDIHQSTFTYRIVKKPPIYSKHQRLPGKVTVGRDKGHIGENILEGYRSGDTWK